tara:strand:- start:346 stop:804 length:459 start_codon:yes stop_codon:yes gene_type:complete
MFMVAARLLPQLRRGHTAGVNGSSVLAASRWAFSTDVVDQGEVKEVNMDAMHQDYAKEIADIMEGYEERKKRKQSLVGVITSTKCAKSITVQVEHEKFFPKYNKSVKSRKKVMAHDEDETGNVGDVVRIVPCRPVSKKKRHALIDVIRAAEQ